MRVTLFALRGYLALGLVVPAAAAEFSQRLTPAEFAAAGLGRLSAAELARLDALVRAQTVTTVAAGPATADAAPAKPQTWRERMRVILTPGTEVAWQPLETALRGPFHGYEPGQVLTLANGQRWRVVEGRYWSPAKSADQPRKVVVQPGVMGGFFLEIADGGRPKVVYVDTLE